MTDQIYHRMDSDDVIGLVETSGEVWGKQKRIVAGGGAPCVKAFVGPLPDGQFGYSFTTEVSPTRHRYFFGIPGVEWMDGWNRRRRNRQLQSRLC